METDKQEEKSGQECGEFPEWIKHIYKLAGLSDFRKIHRYNLNGQVKCTPPVSPAGDML
jgi:hypothetical protein